MTGENRASKIKDLERYEYEIDRIKMREHLGDIDLLYLKGLQEKRINYLSSMIKAIYRDEHNQIWKDI